MKMQGELELIYEVVDFLDNFEGADLDIRELSLIVEMITWIVWLCQLEINQILSFKL